MSRVESGLDAGLDVNATDEDETTALHVAAANGNEAVVRVLLMRGASLDKANTMGWTPLLLASRHGHINVLTLLLQNNADLNARTKLGAGALTLAAAGGHIQTCKLLVDAGADLTPGTRIGGTNWEFTPLMVAAQFGHEVVVRYFIEKGCDVNYRTPSMGMNSLMLAALNGHVTTAQILIEHGGDPNLTNVNDQTPLQIAALSSNAEVKGFLDRKTANKPHQGDAQICRNKTVTKSENWEINVWVNLLVILVKQVFLSCFNVGLAHIERVISHKVI